MIFNRKGDGGSELLQNTLAFLILLGVFVAIIFGFVYVQKNNSLPVAQYYSYQIAQAIDNGKAGDVVTLNIDELAKFAYKQNIADVTSLITFDNNLQMVKIRVSSEVSAEYPFLNNFIVEKVQYGIGPNGNTITFTIGAGE